MGVDETEERATPDAGARTEPVVVPYAPGDRLPWILRGGGAPASPPEPAQREPDRLAALSARRTALVVIPVVAVGWMLAVVLGGDAGARVATIVAVLVCAYVGARAAVTTQRFRQRWMSDEERTAPPRWVTLATVAGAVGAMVAIANVVADLQADRSTVAALCWTVGFLAVTGVGAYAHVEGDRSVARSLRASPPPADRG